MDIEPIDHLPALPPRPADSHKGRFGFVLVIAGSRGMSGAAALAGAAALRSGAGLVRVACPAEVQPIVAAYEPSYMTCPLAADDDGCLCDLVNRPALGPLIEAATAVAVGPGLGHGAERDTLVSWLLEACDRPIVLDADGLNALGSQGVHRLTARAHPTILTPHPGEFSRLTGQTVAAVQSSREASAVALARDSGGPSRLVVVVLKGSRTVVTDGTRLFLNSTGNPGMATGGTGDVLTGVIASLVGQGLDPFDAAALGVHAHGRAGDLARQRRGEVGLIARDLVDSLSDAWMGFPAH